MAGPPVFTAPAPHSTPRPPQHPPPPTVPLHPASPPGSVLLVERWVGGWAAQAGSPFPKWGAMQGGGEGAGAWKGRCEWRQQGSLADSA